MELLKKHCPTCQSQHIKPHTSYSTQSNGQRIIFVCTACEAYFSETKNTVLEGLRTPLSKIWDVLEARTEGMGLNAATRVFHKGKQTIMEWERRFGQLHQVLLIYALVHQFLELVIEGDEAYTKVQKNVPPHESQGWTVALLERASRFLWDLECGKREASLFRQAVERLEKVIGHTGDLSLFTDGERRYGNLLFEICSEVVHTGKPGRPKTTLKPGVKARVKNKGGQTHKKGRKRPKYQTPWAEHPKTTQAVEESMIHANHLEAFWSALRRKCSAFRRRTNTYAKSKGGLQRILHVYWGMHNFVRKHFTTKAVPAVSLGVLERPLSVQELMLIQYA
ncbi:MAG: IS1 family transposase [Anaerolineaceae bacterium]|nr:IS1 family transposase [Anaerolineaceae bacterium]